VHHTTSIAARTESSTWLAVEHVRAFNRDDPKVSSNTRSSHLGMLLHYLGKLKIQVFCRYSADMEENANKLHFDCTGRSADCQMK